MIEISQEQLKKELEYLEEDLGIINKDLALMREKPREKEPQKYFDVVGYEISKLVVEREENLRNQTAIKVLLERGVVKLVIKDK